MARRARFWRVHTIASLTSKAPTVRPLFVVGDGLGAVDASLGWALPFLFAEDSSYFSGQLRGCHPWRVGLCIWYRSSWSKCM